MDDQQHSKKENFGLLNHLEDDRLSALFEQYPFSANLRWELIKRKLDRGDLSLEEIGNQSIYMKDRLSYFKEIEELTQQTSQASPPSTSDVIKDPNTEIEVEAAESSEETPNEVEAIPNIENPIPPEKEEENPEDPSEETEYSDDTPTNGSPEEKPEIEEETPTANTDEFPPRRDIGTPGGKIETTEDEDDHSSPFVKWLRTVSDSATGEKTYRGEPFSRERSVVEKPEKNNEQLEERDSIKKKKNKKKKKGGKIKSKSPKELELQPDIATETLANLLASQGHHEEANEMYRLLSLKYPEKSSYFAAKIKKS
nr:hypothetical protein [Saprospiraceae bacterium]